MLFMYVQIWHWYLIGSWLSNEKRAEMVLSMDSRTRTSFIPNTLSGRPLETRNSKRSKRHWYRGLKLVIVYVSKNSFRFFFFWLVQNKTGSPKKVEQLHVNKYFLFIKNLMDEIKRTSLMLKVNANWHSGNCFKIIESEKVET